MSNKSVNKVILLASPVGHDPEVKYTASGIPVGRFNLATNERFKTKAANSRTAQNGTTLWSGGGLPRSWASLYPKALSSISKEDSKLRVGKTGRAQKRNTD